MGFKDDVRAKADEFEGELLNLTRRVVSLERLAEQIKSSPVPTPARRAEVRRDVTGTAVRTPVAGGVDYGAVAFGLSEIKRKIAHALNAQGTTADHLRDFAGAVQYFADVFAKSDPSFDADTFKRQSGV